MRARDCRAVELAPAERRARRARRRAARARRPRCGRNRSPIAELRRLPPWPVQNIIPDVKNEGVSRQESDSARSAPGRWIGPLAPASAPPTPARPGRLVQATLRLIRETRRRSSRASRRSCERAGLSNQAFYRHFRIKHELLLGGARRGLPPARRAISRTAWRAAATPEAQIARVDRAACSSRRSSARGAAATRPFAVSRARLAGAVPGRGRGARSAQLTAPLRDARSRPVREPARCRAPIPSATPRRSTPRDRLAASAQLAEREPAPRARGREQLVEFALRRRCQSRAPARERAVGDGARESCSRASAARASSSPRRCSRARRSREGREVMLLGSYGGTMRGGNTDSTLVVADAPDLVAADRVARLVGDRDAPRATSPALRREARARRGRGL